MSQAELADRVGDLGSPSFKSGWPGVSCADAVVPGREDWEEAGHERCCIASNQHLNTVSTDQSTTLRVAVYHFRKS